MIRFELRESAHTFHDVKEFSTASEAHRYMLRRAEFWRTTKMWDAWNNYIMLELCEISTDVGTSSVAYVEYIHEKMFVCRYANIWEREKRFENEQL